MAKTITVLKIADLLTRRAKTGVVAKCLGGDDFGDGNGVTMYYDELSLDTPDTSPGSGTVCVQAVDTDPLIAGRWLIDPTGTGSLTARLTTLSDRVEAGFDGDLITDLINDLLYLYIKKPPILSTITANTTLVRTGVFLTLGVISANRTLTLPDPTKNKSAFLFILNANTATFTWSFSGTVKTPFGDTITTTLNGKFYYLYSDGIKWIAINSNQLNPNGHKVHGTADGAVNGGTVTLVKNKLNIIRPTGSLSTLTVVMPGSPIDNDGVRIKFIQAVTTLGYSGGTPDNASVNPSAKSLVEYTWDAALSLWL